MKTVLFKKTFTSIIAFSGACLLPVTSYATDYSNRYYSNDCYQNSNDQLAAGLFGAVIGGVVGSRIAGRGDRTEGSVIGAILGGTTAAAISESGRSNGYNPNCEKIRRQTRSRNYRYNHYPRNNNLDNFSNQQDYYSARSRVNTRSRSNNGRVRGNSNYRSRNDHGYEHQHDHEHHHSHYHYHGHSHYHD